MKYYFVSPYFYDGLDITTFVGNDEQKAVEDFIEENSTMPYDLMCWDDEQKKLYILSEYIDKKVKWRDCGKQYIAVRVNPHLGYPETVIAKNGIFETMEAAMAFAAEIKGSWKLYSFDELREKLVESKLLMDEARRIETSKPF